jgi:hypothetical protein
MPTTRPPVVLTIAFLTLAIPLLAQAPLSVPRTFWFTGVVRDANGQPRTGPTQLLLAIYKHADGGVPLVQ